MSEFKTTFDDGTVASEFVWDKNNHNWPLDVTVADDNNELVSPISFSPAEAKALYFFLKEYIEPKLTND